MNDNPLQPEDIWSHPMPIKEELTKLVNEFAEDVYKHNAKRLSMPTDFEDDTELTFENFIKWLNF